MFHVPEVHALAVVEIHFAHGGPESDAENEAHEKQQEQQVLLDELHHIHLAGSVRPESQKTKFADKGNLCFFMEESCHFHRCCFFVLMNAE